jgi:hypothetical protein
MRRVSGHFDNGSTEEEFFRPQTGDDVFHRQLQLLDGERARITEADDRAATTDELLEALQICRRQLVGVFGAYRYRRATASSTAGRRAGDRHASVIGHDQDIDLLRER